jgi:hypothetical protein
MKMKKKTSLSDNEVHSDLYIYIYTYIFIYLFVRPIHTPYQYDSPSLCSIYFRLTGPITFGVLAPAASPAFGMPVKKMAFGTAVILLAKT